MEGNEFEPVPSEPAFTGRDVLYRERGLSTRDVQRAADALLKRGIKPSIAAVREELGGGSPNTVGPLLEQYWKNLGARLPEGSKALDRVPESLARLSETLWLRALAEAKERLALLSRPEGSSPAALSALELKVAELTAALAEARSEIARKESELLVVFQERLAQGEQIRSLTALLTAEQQLRERSELNSQSQARELDARRSELIALARRRLGRAIERSRKKVTRKARPKRSLAAPAKPRKPRAAVKGRATARTRLKRQGHR